MANKKTRKEEPIEVVEGEPPAPKEFHDPKPAEVVHDQTPSFETPAEDEQPAPAEPGGFESLGAGWRFFPAAPMRFAVHASFYYAGRTADKIVSLYNRAFRLDKAYVADFNKSTGMAYVRHGHWEKAIPLLEKALAVNPDDQDTRLRLAEAYGGADEYEKSCRHLEKILEQDPDSARVLRALGIAHSRRQDYDRAIEYLERAVKLDPDHAKAYYRLGVAYDNRKQYKQAVEAFKKCIQVDPRFAKAYQALGFAHESMGDRESAVDCFKKALELD